MADNEQFVIITGMSGAGKTLAMQTCEDLGYFCVDNIPPALIPKFMELVHTSSEIKKVALVIDLRAPASYREIVDTLVEMANDKDTEDQVIFLDASDEKLVSRYKESRRTHPLARNGRVVDGIEKERKLMKRVKDSADLVINTSDLTPQELREEIIHKFELSHSEPFHVELMSFGFKYGLPIDADIILDVRFLKNPFYVVKLRSKTGKDQDVYDYVMNQDEANEFYKKVFNLVKFTLPKFKKEGKSTVTMAIGCTGGQHRSVAMVERLAKDIKDQLGYPVNVTHRDINRHKGVK
ncbi:RNase adapter RapZ [Fructilactobacillus fructivorans]|uniref:RNase adapter RapZ n=1 Tax=Fructilactobacillus fructivorans TaxID=1614 RepID=A0AAE6TYK5_9LACO|nr:RNase adapter RapZ [Fructilactobacillus fructivorans]KRK57752.1 glmZ(sRNA)-inactivating NTPase [Fructilactobacillus fructivorans]KRN40629.1 glmZ(sRNA)-inactivating NTPase [Fructilactobacillus fructivorans]KRN43170.1 glmZ(sRNA)-inactivating NTPase [Fructilactobacillus fructivorans]QFX92970.1 RNase adapter RapZ [Fructilactobacillus fructivorans]RDV65428.1 RNase adapter RapZ [Fructilactobacillus fructivorans]